MTPEDALALVEDIRRKRGGHRMRQEKMTRDSFHVFQANARNALKQSEQVPSILICAGTGCIAGGAMKIYDNLKTECEKRGLPVYEGASNTTRTRRRASM